MYKALQKLFGQISEIPVMAKQDQVRQNVPADAVYVSLAACAVVSPPSGFLDVQKGNSMAVYSFAQREHIDMPIMYVLHNGTDFVLIREQREILRVPLTNITGLDYYWGGGFVLQLDDGRGIALSTPTPVEECSDMQFRTISGMTDVTSGWLTQLEPYGTKLLG